MAYQVASDQNTKHAKKKVLFWLLIDNHQQDVEYGERWVKKVMGGDHKLHPPHLQVPPKWYFYLQWVARKWHFWVVEKKCMTHQHPMTALRISYFYQWKYNDISMQNIYDNHCSYMYVCIVTQFDPDWHWGKPDGILQAADARGILPYFARGVPFLFNTFLLECSIFILPFSAQVF